MPDVSEYAGLALSLWGKIATQLAHDVPAFGALAIETFLPPMTASESRIVLSLLAFIHAERSRLSTESAEGEPQAPRKAGRRRRG